MHWLVARLRAYKPPAHNLVILFVALACVTGLALEGWPIWQSRITAILLDRTETGNLSQSLAQYAHDTIEIVDTALIGLRERLEVDGMAGDSPDRFQGLMESYIARLPMLRGLFVYDAAGNLVARPRSMAALQSANNSDRAYFQYHRDHGDRQVHVDVPIRSRSIGDWVLPVSVRIDKPDGSFAGVVLAAVPVRFFQDYYRAFEPGAGGVITLFSASGIVVARSPADGNVIGTDLSKGPVLRHLSQSSMSSTLRYRSPVDDVERYGSVHRVPGYPLVVLVSHSAVEVLADWWSDVLRYLTIACMALAAMIVIGIRMAQQIKRQTEVEQHYRLLADYSADAIVCATPAGRRLYVSPSFVGLTGWSIGEIRRMHWSSIVEPSDRPALESVVASLEADGSPVTVCYRYIRKNDDPLWVEASIRKVPSKLDPEGQFIANIRDITKRKAVEDKVAALNRELAAQASTDGLTGLANRRSFDEKLEHEWRRARRDGSSLSLLMIDVDRFKLYNDAYGHQRGDDCLRAVSREVQAAMRRSTDIVARYGGEEIVVILPDTDAAVAGEIGERVRRNIEDADLVHHRNPPRNVVTVSIGAATIRLAPLCDIASTSLVSAADRALYDAKHAGRNRVVTADQDQPDVLASAARLPA